MKEYRNAIRSKKMIKEAFDKLVNEKQSIEKVTVKEIVELADISKSTFYAHYDDIYCVAEDYENELIDTFFSKAKLIKSTNYEDFMDSFFNYIEENDENYKMLCKSNDFLFAAKKLSTIASNKFIELFNNDSRLKNKDFLNIEINVFIEGLLCEYVKYCRGYSENGITQLYEYTKYWVKNFVNKRFGEQL